MPEKAAFRYILCEKSGLASRRETHPDAVDALKNGTRLIGA